MPRNHAQWPLLHYKILLYFSSRFASATSQRLLWGFISG